MYWVLSLRLAIYQMYCLWILILIITYEEQHNKGHIYLMIFL